MKKLMYLIVLIVVLGLIVPGCLPVVPPTEQNEPGSLPNKNLGDVFNVPSVSYPTIQDAINAATGGETIIVAAGTYSPLSTIIIDKHNLTLNGPQANVDPRPSYGSTRTAGSALEAVIDGGGTLYNIILIEANNVVINGFEVKSGTGDMIKQDSSHAGTVVKYNIIHDGLGDEGVQLKKCTNGVLEYNYVFEIADPGDGLNIADSSSYGTIQYNEVCGIHGENAAIYIYGSEHMEIIGNLVRDSGTGLGNDGIKVGAKGTGDATKKYVLVKDNIIHDITQDGISVYMSDVTVEGNEIYNCHSENGAIYLAYAISNIDIHDNAIYNNTLKTTKRLTSAGILLEYRVDATSVTVHNNNIYNNTPYGITNEATDPLDATCNWWGDASGPYHSTNTSGTGNPVSDNVTFSPWNGGGESPVIGTITINPVALGALTELIATFTGPTGGTATIDWGDGDTETVNNADGTVTGSHTYASTGVYTVTVTITITNDCGSNSDTEFSYAVVYDPSDGFVTGGGWIDSPAGAYTSDPTLTGPANFGFVSKYKKGQSTPIGNTEFKFKAGDLNFQSDSYDWLVIAGAKAMYKGTGTINGDGNYGFMLSAIDEELTPSTDVDLFRIKIWDKDTDDIIYDNNLGGEDNAEPATAISGGQIVIHKAK